MKTLTKYYEDLVLNPEPNCFCMLKPGFAKYKDEFEKLLNLQGWKIIAQCIKKFTRDEIEDFYIMHKDKPFYHKLCDYMITDDCVCYTCHKNCQDPFKDMDAFKKKIRDEWGEDEMKNGMHSSDCKENMKKECLIAFNTVNEKLKISNKEEVTPNTTVTYLMFFNKIQKYCKSHGCKNFVPGVIDNSGRPEFVYEDNFVITNIWPTEDDIKKLVFRLSNLTEKKYKLHTIEVTGNEDKLVDFITPEWVDKIMKYLKVY
jgi:nucleoside-diphosphate kinase